MGVLKSIQHEGYLRGLREAHAAVRTARLEYFGYSDEDGTSEMFDESKDKELRAIAALIAKAEAERGDSDGG